MISTAIIYLSLFFSSFLAASILPLTADGVVVYMAMNNYNTVATIMIATAGSFLGSLTMYYFGLYGRKKILEKYLDLDNEKMKRFEQVFKKYGAPVFLFSWVPIVGDAFVAMGGILKVDFLTFSIYAFLGKAVKYTILAYVALSFV